ncbi:hypothetical protein GQ54DRAFT_207929 [Martensiomyces pterosporus]|nr:hypothetical protein GQ54DRAFT_207929 [Martensiomyces pterosporus]
MCEVRGGGVCPGCLNMIFCGHSPASSSVPDSLFVLSLRPSGRPRLIFPNMYMHLQSQTNLNAQAYSSPAWPRLLLMSLAAAADNIDYDADVLSIATDSRARRCNCCEAGAGGRGHLRPGWSRAGAAGKQIRRCCLLRLIFLSTPPSIPSFPAHSFVHSRSAVFCDIARKLEEGKPMALRVCAWIQCNLKR